MNWQPWPSYQGSVSWWHHSPQVAWYYAVSSSQVAAHEAFDALSAPVGTWDTLHRDVATTAQADTVLSAPPGAALAANVEAEPRQRCRDMCLRAIGAVDEVYKLSHSGVPVQHLDMARTALVGALSSVTSELPDLQALASGYGHLQVFLRMLRDRSEAQQTTEDVAVASRAAASIYRDALVWTTVSICGVSCRDTFLSLLSSAFGDVAFDDTLRSQMLNSYHQILRSHPGAFTSKSSWLASRRGKRTRKRRNHSPDTSDGSEKHEHRSEMEHEQMSSAVDIVQSCVLFPDAASGIKVSDYFTTSFTLNMDMLLEIPVVNVRIEKTRTYHCAGISLEERRMLCLGFQIPRPLTLALPKRWHGIDLRVKSTFIHASSGELMDDEKKRGRPRSCPGRARSRL
eukprot:TRINITY_DN65028_c0_g1_i1.p1 TRINITY_DN65028_c0_g1~~TRINITY_DN65028_c0_g1_i1.p1  ORF type:complete len:399 (-),score=46.00 TRINITY_DN65028_c0_g1_i1:260-1456(-)